MKKLRETVSEALRATFAIALLAALVTVTALGPCIGTAHAGVTSQLTQGVQVTVTGAPELGGSNFTLSASWGQDFKDGTALNQVNKYFQDSVTLAGSGTITFDLDSALTGTIGETVTFARIAAILVRRTNTPAASSQDENVNVGGDFVLTKLLAAGGDTLANTTLPIRPGGRFVFIAPDATGVAITAATGDQLTFTNASAADSVTLQVLILGS